jgi:hypothetical protein
MDENKILERITVNPKILGGGNLSFEDAGLLLSTSSGCLPQEIPPRRFYKAIPGLSRMISRPV